MRRPETVDLYGVTTACYTSKYRYHTSSRGVASYPWVKVPEHLEIFCTMFAWYIFFSLILVTQAIDPNCSLKIENENEFDENIIDYISEKSIVEIIQFNLDFSSLGPGFNLSNRTNPKAVEPDKWYRIKDKQKARILLAHNGYLFKIFLANVYKEIPVRLNATPYDCINNISVNDMEGFIRDFMIKDFHIADRTIKTSIRISDTAEICTAHLNKEYVCWRYDLHGNLVSEHIGQDIEFNIATYLVTALVLILYLYSPLILPSTDDNLRKEIPIKFCIECKVKINKQANKIIIDETKIDINKTTKMITFQSKYKDIPESDEYLPSRLNTKQGKREFLKEGQPVITSFWSLITFASGYENHSPFLKEWPKLFYFIKLFLFVLFFFVLPTLLSILINTKISQSIFIINICFIICTLVFGFCNILITDNPECFLNSFRENMNNEKKCIYKFLNSFNLKCCIGKQPRKSCDVFKHILHKLFIHFPIFIIYMLFVTVFISLSLVYTSPLSFILRTISTISVLESFNNYNCMSHCSIECVGVIFCKNFIFIYTYIFNFILILCVTLSYVELVFTLVILLMFPTSWLHSLIPAVSAFILYIYALLGTLRKKHDACLKSIVEKKKSDPSKFLEVENNTDFTTLSNRNHELVAFCGDLKLKLKRCILYTVDNDQVYIERNALFHFMSDIYLKAVEEIFLIVLFIFTVVWVVYALGSSYYINISNQMFITLVFSLLPSLIKLVKDKKNKDNKLNELDLELNMSKSFEWNVKSYYVNEIIDDIIIDLKENTENTENAENNEPAISIHYQIVPSNLKVNDETESVEIKRKVKSEKERLLTKMSKEKKEKKV